MAGTKAAITIARGGAKIMTQHTPGPWYADKERDGEGNELQIIHVDGQVIAYIDGFQNMTDPHEAEANARLIAAAPELLLSAMLDDLFPAVTDKKQEELETMAKEMGWAMDMPVEHFAKNYRRAAIAKARGQS